MCNYYTDCMNAAICENVACNLCKHPMIRQEIMSVGGMSVKGVASYVMVNQYERQKIRYRHRRGRNRNVTQKFLCFFKRHLLAKLLCASMERDGLSICHLCLLRK